MTELTDYAMEIRKIIKRLDEIKLELAGIEVDLIYYDSKKQE